MESRVAMVSIAIILASAKGVTAEDRFAIMVSRAAVVSLAALVAFADRSNNESYGDGF